LMHKGKIEEANALAIKIGTLITKHNSRQLTNLKEGKESVDLWRMVKKVTGRNSYQVSPPGITSDTLNNHYASISNDPAYAPPISRASCNKASTTVFTEYKVFRILDQLKNTATGLDSLPAWYLRISAPVLAKPLAALLNLSLSSSHVPTQWKSSYIHPIPKIPSPSKPADFRPISITPVLSRLTERVIVSTYVYPNFLKPHPYLTFSDQFAFRPTGSTTNALISLLQTVSHMLTDQPFVRVITLDFTKAFDSVKHSELLSKYAALDLPDNIHNWLVNFFTGRKHSTKFDGVFSDLESISSSVIQGSALGPASYAVVASDLRPI